MYATQLSYQTQDLIYSRTEDTLGTPRSILKTNDMLQLDPIYIHMTHITLQKIPNRCRQWNPVPWWGSRLANLSTPRFSESEAIFIHSGTH